MIFIRIYSADDYKKGDNLRKKISQDFSKVSITEKRETEVEKIKVDELMKSNRSLKIILIVYSIIAVLIPTIVWIVYHGMDWASWNSMFLSYFGGAIGGTATLIAVIISTNQTREIQDENKKENKRIQDENKKDADIKKKLDIVRVGTTIMPIMCVEIIEWKQDQSGIKITNNGINIGKIKSVEVNGIKAEKSIFVKVGSDAVNIKYEDFKKSIDIRALLEDGNTVTIIIEFYDLINNLYEQKFTAKVKDAYRCYITDDMPKIKKIAEIDESILRA